MRRSLGALIALGLFLTNTTLARADEQAEARKIIDKAIKAHGGEEKLAKQKAVVANIKGTALGSPFTGEFSMQLPEQRKANIDVEVNGQKFNVLFIVDGDRGWLRLGNEVQDMPKDVLEEHRTEMYAVWVTTLAPLKDKAFTLAPLGDVKVEDKAAVGVRVSRKDRPDVSLFFDKESGLLLKSENGIKPAGGNLEVSMEVFFSDYADIGGVKQAKKMVVKRDNKPHVDGEVVDWQYHEKLDKSVFGKP